MKNLFTSSLLIASVMFSLTSCETDEPSTNDEVLWKGELEAPAYASDAALYIINADNIKSIELTGSGLYFITPITVQDNSKSTSMFRKPTASRVASSESIVSGVFNKIDNNTYELTGYGTVTIGDESIIIDRIDGLHLEYKLEKVNQIEMTAQNSRLCRTWYVEAAKIEFLDRNLNVVGSHNFTKAEIAEEFVQYFTFTRSGRMYEYDDEWYGYTWEWYNAKSQVIYAKSDNEDAGDGVFQILFDDAKMTIVIPEFHDDNEEITWEYGDICTVPSSAVNTKTYLITTNFIPE